MPLQALRLRVRAAVCVQSAVCQHDMYGLGNVPPQAADKVGLCRQQPAGLHVQHIENRMHPLMDIAAAAAAAQKILDSVPYLPVGLHLQASGIHDPQGHTAGRSHFIRFEFLRDRPARSRSTQRRTGEVVDQRRLAGARLSEQQDIRILFHSFPTGGRPAEERAGRRCTKRLCTRSRNSGEVKSSFHATGCPRSAFSVFTAQTSAAAVPSA